MQNTGYTGYHNYLSQQNQLQFQQFPSNPQHIVPELNHGQIPIVAPIIRKPYPLETLLNIKSKPNGVVIGQTGCGKTTLYNLICKTNYETGVTEDSMTKLLVQHEVNIGEHSLTLIDTPGTDGKEEAFKSATILRHALTCSPHNVVQIVVKFDPRLNKIYDYFFKALRLINKQEDMVVLMISHWDEVTKDSSQDTGKVFKKICDVFDKKEAKISNIICYSKHSSAESVATLMCACAANLQPKSIKITEEEFLLYFNIQKISSDWEKEYKIFKDECGKVITAFLNALPKLPKEDRDEIVFALINSLKDQIQRQHDSFLDKFGGKMIELDCQTFAIKMQKRMVKINNLFVEKAKNFLSFNLADKSDPRNLIKKCNYCGLIWWKVEGCDGVTTCGNPPTGYYDIQEKPWQKQVINYFQGVINWIKNEMPKTGIKQKQVVKQEGEANQVKQKGCGSDLNWGTLPPLPLEELFKLLQVKDLDEAKEIIKNERFHAIRRNYEMSFQYWNFENKQMYQPSKPQQGTSYENSYGRGYQSYGTGKGNHGQGQTGQGVEYEYSPYNMNPTQMSKPKPEYIGENSQGYKTPQQSVAPQANTVSFENNVKIIESLGVEKNSAVKALAKANGDLAWAMEILFPSEEKKETTLPKHPQKMNEEISKLPPETKKPENCLQDTKKPEEKQENQSTIGKYEKEVKTLMDFGATKTNAVKALIKTNGDLDAAIELVFGTK